LHLLGQPNTFLAAADPPQVPPQVMCNPVDNEPPAPSPTDRLWRPHYHHVGYNQTGRGHIQDPSGVIFDVATKTWHLFNDCWPCQPQPSLHWCHVSSKDLVHWKTHPIIRDSRPQFNNLPWSVGTGSIGRATNGSYFTLFGGCARTEDPDFQEWTTLATPGFCMCDNIAFPNGTTDQVRLGQCRTGPHDNCTAGCATNQPDASVLNCSQGMLDTSRPFEVKGSWYIITECVGTRNQDLNGSRAVMARWRDRTNGSFMGWEYDGVLFTAASSDWAGKETGTPPYQDCSGSEITDLECPDFFAPPSSEDSADQTELWVVSGGRSMVGGGSWACRYLCTAAGPRGCPASIAAGCKIQPDHDDWSYAWEGEGSHMSGAGNMYATGHLNEEMKLQVMYNSTYDFGTFYAAKTGAWSEGVGNTGSGRHLLFGWV
jgi:hypothetical protein